MGQRFVAFDVETPNHRNNRISAIGITVLENGAIVQQWQGLVNPQTYFEPFHMALTGITPEKVADKPTFAQLWQQIVPLMESGLLVAHNAPFDLAVLSKCLQHDHITWQPTVDYICTCQMSRRQLPQLPNHRLDTLCAHLQLDLKHHDAGSDSRACAQLLLYCLQQGASIAPFVRRYNLLRACTEKKRPDTTDLCAQHG